MTYAELCEELIQSGRIGRGRVTLSGAQLDAMRGAIRGMMRGVWPGAVWPEDEPNSERPALAPPNPALPMYQPR